MILRKTAKENGIFVYESNEAVFADIGVDVIVIATSNDVHEKLVIDALNSGHNVICEKPVALSVAEFDRMVSAAKDNKNLLAVHQNRRWDMDFLSVKNVIKSGEIWHFNRPVYKNLSLTPSMMIADNNKIFEVVSGGYQLSEDNSIVTTLRNGKILLATHSILNKNPGEDLDYVMEFSLETPTDANLATATDNAVDRNNKGFMFGYDENNESYWMFAFKYENGGFYPYIRHSSNVNGICKGMDKNFAFESGTWYDYKISVTEKDSGTDIEVQYKPVGTNKWQVLMSSYSFAYKATGRRVGFLAAGPMKFGANISITPSVARENSFAWDDNWSEALDEICK